MVVLTILNMLVAGKISKQSGCLAIFFGYVLHGGAITILKNMSSSMVAMDGGLSHILWIIKNVPNHQPEYLGLICDSR